MDPIEYNIRNRLTDELVKMVRYEFADYTEEALEIAKDELRRRGVSPELRKDEPDDADGPNGGGQGERPAEDTSSINHEGWHAKEGAADILRQIRSGALNRDALLTLFINNELEYVEAYEAISDFVGSMNIRCGEYQGSVAVIKKMDVDNFILFAEDIDENGGKQLLGCVGLGKSELTDRMDEIARQKGYAEAEESPFEGYTF